MPKRTSKPKRKSASSSDPNVLAHRSVQAIAALSGEQTTEISASMLHDVMSAMGTKGGKIGGKRRLETMTAEERTTVALKAARARWNKRNGKG